MAEIKLPKTANGVGPEEAGLASPEVIASLKDEVVSLCFPASELFGEKIYNGFGTLVESYIAFELEPFLAKNGVAPLDLYLDPSFESVSYLGFLKGKNPHLFEIDNEDRLVERRPDILIHTPRLAEYYEIKPNSISGRRAGREKLVDLTEIYSEFALPYVPGDSFDLPDEIEIGTTSIIVRGTRIPVKISFGLERQKALILYNICIETNWKRVLAAKALDLLLRALLDLLQAAFARSTEFIGRVAAAIAEQGPIILAIGGIALILILVLTGAVSMPAGALTAILLFFVPTVEEKAEAELA